MNPWMGVPIVLAAILVGICVVQAWRYEWSVRRLPVTPVRPRWMDAPESPQLGETVRLGEFFWNVKVFGMASDPDTPQMATLTLAPEGGLMLPVLVPEDVVTREDVQELFRQHERLFHPSASR